MPQISEIASSQNIASGLVSHLLPQTPSHKFSHIFVMHWSRHIHKLRRASLSKLQLLLSTTSLHYWWLMSPSGGRINSAWVLNCLWISSAQSFSQDWPKFSCRSQVDGLFPAEPLRVSRRIQQSITEPWHFHQAHRINLTWARRRINSFARSFALNW